MALVQPLKIESGQVTRIPVTDDVTLNVITGSNLIVDDGGTGAFLSFDAGSGAGLSGAGTARLRYDQTASPQVLELSENGGAYFAIGDVRGPASATDNALVRYDLTTGKRIQNNTQWTLGDTGILAGVVSIASGTWPFTLQNNTLNGEFIRLINSNGNPIYEFDMNSSADPIFRMQLNAGGIVGFVHGDGGYTAIGPGYTSSTPNTSWPLEVQGVLAGGNGVNIMCGEVLGDIALHVNDADDTFGDPGGAIMELEADQGYVTFYKGYAQTLADRGIVWGIDNQNPNTLGQADFNTQFGVYRMGGTAIPLKLPCRVVSTTNRTLSGEQTIDGVLTSASRVLVAGQTTASQNGIYISAAGAWSRAGDFNTSADLTSNCIIPITSGTVYARSVWRLTTNGPYTLGTTSLAFSTAQRAVRTLTFGSEYNNGSQGASWTLNWTNGQKQRVTLTASTTTLTITPPAGVGNFLLKIIQGGAGSFTVTWPASVRWPGGTAPTLSTAPGAIDIISFYYDGTNYYAVGNLNFQ